MKPSYLIFLVLALAAIWWIVRRRNPRKGKPHQASVAGPMQSVGGGVIPASIEGNVTTGQ